MCAIIRKGFRAAHCRHPQDAGQSSAGRLVSSVPTTYQTRLASRTPSTLLKHGPDAKKCNNAAIPRIVPSAMQPRHLQRIQCPIMPSNYADNHRLTVTFCLLTTSILCPSHLLITPLVQTHTLPLNQSHPSPPICRQSLLCFVHTFF